MRLDPGERVVSYRPDPNRTASVFVLVEGVDERQALLYLNLPTSSRRYDFTPDEPPKETSSDRV